MLPPDLHLQIEDRLGVTVESVSPVSGGCISHTGKIVTSGGTFFAKWGEASVARTYVPEMEGLNRLRAACGIIRIPEVIEIVVLESGAGLLLMEWIDVVSPTHECWAEMGRGLAEMHRTGQEDLDDVVPGYGFGANNFIGGTLQTNDWKKSWPGFFADCRLMPQWEAASRAGLLKQDWDPMFSEIIDHLPDMLPASPIPSLVHGDLWTGNVLSDSAGRPVLIDPAVYYGHAEVDLAMTRLFGRFLEAFYRAYDEASARVPSDGHVRHQVYDLYHLLNHLNLFGTGYQSSVESTMRSLL